MTHLTDKNICLSGGAKGSDLYWGELALNNNHEVKHYIFHDFNNGKYPENSELLSTQSLNEAKPYLEEANRSLHRVFPCSTKYVNNLLKRNYWQVKHSKTLYAVAEMDHYKECVHGGTAWAVQMFLDMGKTNCYILCKNSLKWYCFDKRFVEMNELPPKPQGIYTGIGSRDINEKHKLMMKELYENG